MQILRVEADDNAVEILLQAEFGAGCIPGGKEQRSFNGSDFGPSPMEFTAETRTQKGSPTSATAHSKEVSRAVEAKEV